MLRALAKAPVTVPILHELKCGAVVSKLRKHENESVSTEAKLLIKQWKGLAAAAGVPQTSKAPAPPAKKHIRLRSTISAILRGKQLERSSKLPRGGRVGRRLHPAAEAVE